MLNTWPLHFFYFLHAKEFLLYFTWPLSVTLLRAMILIQTYFYLKPRMYEDDTYCVI